MGQNVSTVQEYTPDNKPAKTKNSQSLEKPRNENEENELNEKSEKAEKEKQKKLGINVMKKHSKMPMKMESFIIDTIIVEKLKYSGHFGDIANAIAKKMNNKYGGFWCVIISKPLNGCLSPINGTHIFLAYENCDFTIFRGFDQNIFMNKLPTDKPKNENEENNLKEMESLKAIQKKLGINVLKSTMKMNMESFIIDTIIVEKLKHSGSFNEIANAIKVKLEDQYGSSWNVLIAKTGDLPESGYCVTTILGSYITLEYDLCKYTVFKSM